MNGSILLSLAQALKDKDKAPLKKARTELSTENKTRLLELIEEYKDVPHLKPVLHQEKDDEVALFILLLKHDVKMEQCRTLFETHKAIALKQDIQAKQLELDAIIESKNREIESLKDLVKTTLNAMGNFPKFAQENEQLKQMLFEVERKSSAMEKRLMEQCSTLSGAHQARIHQVREQSTQMLNDEYMKLITHIRGELRKNPVDKDSLLEGINEHTDNMRLVVGKSLI